MASSAPYIARGRVIRRGGSTDFRESRPMLSWKRMFLLIIPVAILVATNPATEEYLATLDDEARSGGFVVGSSVYRRRRFTNHGVFSLEKKFDAVQIHALRQSWSCPFNDNKIGSFCNEIASHYCNRKPLIWDITDRVYTSRRLLSMALILSALFFFVCPDCNPGFHPVFSIFYRPNLILDLIHVQILITPALEGMSAVLRTLRSGSIFSTGHGDWDFVLSSVLLIGVIGNGANALANRVCGRGNASGFGSVCAACLTYSGRLDGPLLWMFEKRQVTKEGLFWAYAALLLVYETRTRNPKSRYPRLVAWLVAGLAGSLLAKYHMEDIFLVGGLFKFFA